MANNTIKLNTPWNKEKTIRLLKKLRIPIAILIVFAIIMLIFASVGETRRSSISDSFRAIPTSFGNSPGFPYDEDDLTMKKTILIGDKPLIVTSNGIQVLSSNADELFNLHIDWGDTKAISNNGRAFVFSNSSNKSYLISRTKQLACFDSEGPTITGTVSKNGCVAFANTLDKVQSYVSVYNTRQKQTFGWNCSNDYVSSLSLSDNGKKLAVSALGVENAEIYSRILLFKTGKSEPKFEVKLSGTSILKVVYSGSNIVAVGDNKTLIINSKGETKSTIEYSDDALFAVDNDANGNTLLAYKEFGGSKIKIVRIPSSGTKTKEFEIDFIPTSLDMNTKRISASLDDKVYLYSFKGELKKTYDCSSNVSSALITSTCIYTVENGRICKY